MSSESSELPLCVDSLQCILKFRRPACWKKNRIAWHLSIFSFFHADNHYSGVLWAGLSLWLGLLIPSLSWLLGMSSARWTWLLWNLGEHSLWTSACPAVLCCMCHWCHWKCLYPSSTLTSSATDQLHASKATSYFLDGFKKRFCLEVLSNLPKSYKTRTKKFCVLCILFPDSQIVNMLPYLLSPPSPSLCFSSISVPLCLFLNYLKVANFMPLYWLQWVSPKNKAILVLNSTVIKVRNFHLGARSNLIT